jgi:hypothetical protein
MSKRKPSRHVTGLLRSFRFCSREAVKFMRSAEKKRAVVARKYAPLPLWEYHERAWASDIDRGWAMFWHALANLRAAQKESRRKS